MAVIGWDETKPAGADSLGLGDDEIRSLKTALRTGLGAEHLWPSGGGDAGIHLPGSARVYGGTQSLVSSTGTEGRLMQTSDTSRLFGVGSGGTSFLGGPTVISAGSFPGSLPQRAIWVEEFGTGMTISGTTTISFPNSGYSGKPYIFITSCIAGNPALNNASLMWVRTNGITGSAFIVDSRATNGVTTSSDTFFWRSIGTRTT